MSLDGEREFPAVQRGLVDICFEEAQYESGIDVLTSLRSSRYKPPPHHIRQLVCLSLSPPPMPSKASSSNANPNDLADAMSSPQRIRLPKGDLWPKPSSRQKALVLLRSFVTVNSPGSLMRAFPFYSYVNEDGIHDVNPFNNEDTIRWSHEDNTPIRDEVLKFQSLKDCWECLKDGFIRRKYHDQVSRTKRQYTPTDDDFKEKSSTIIGPHAWPIFEWFISIFEQDQELQRQSCGVAISPLLLVQIPPPKIKQGPRIVLDVPLEILRECFVPPLNSMDASILNVDSGYLIPQKRVELGMRLLSLLFNLTLTNPPFISPSQLTERLSIILRDFEFDPLSFFFSSLRCNQAIFKLNVLESLLTKHDERSKAPTAKARAKPRARNTNQMQSETLKESEPIKEAFVVPSLERVTSSLLYRPTHEHDIPKVGLMKYHIVSALFEARNNVDMKTFDEAVKGGSLNRTVEEGFGRSQAMAKYKKITLNMLEAWHNQLQCGTS